MKKLVVLGGGESGCGAAVLAKRRGWDVFLSDKGQLAEVYRAMLEREGVPFEEGGHTEERVLTTDQVVKSPGIPDSVPLVRRLAERGIPVMSEIEFAGRYTDAKIIGVTGANGKTTTATLVYRMLKDAGFDVALAGNVGDSFAMSVAEGRRDWYVLELSSFQLDGTLDFRADIALLTNITPDHLDRYDNDIRKYAASKMGIIRNQRRDDWFIWCADDPVSRETVGAMEITPRQLPFSISKMQDRTEASSCASWEGARLDGGEFVAEAAGRKFAFPVAELKIKGRHNLYNAMSATLAAIAAGVPGESIGQTLRSFEGIEHRLEPAGMIDGVEYINDSKATNPDSVWYALECMDRPAVWIAGGSEKGADFTTLREIASRKVKALVCMGVDNGRLIEAMRGAVPEIYDTHSLEEAMRAAKRAARPGDVVLLSPACASFDLFRNYEDRGRQFKEWVKEHR